MQRRRPIISTSESKVDKISSLPDEILFRILSFVSTKEAVATSVLSKRWTNLWHYLPNIDFTDIRVNTVESNLRFNEFVYSVLVSRDASGSRFIDSFHLNIQYSDSHLAYNKEFPNLTKWVNSVVQRGLKYLHLRLRVPLPDHFSGYPYFPKLPISIFTCKTLVSLNLSWFRVDGFSFTSVGFEFPSLKTLSLRLIKFSEVRDFMLLLAGCPILEDLHVALVFFYYEEDSHTVQEFKSLTLPKLTKADVSKCWCSCYMVKALSSSVSLCMETSMFYAKDDRVYKVSLIMDMMHATSIYVALTFHIEEESVVWHVSVFNTPTHGFHFSAVTCISASYISIEYNTLNEWDGKHKKCNSSNIFEEFYPDLIVCLCT